MPSLPCSRGVVCLAALLALVAHGCGGGSPAEPTPAGETGVFYLSYAPDPAVASASPQPDTDWVTRFTVRIRESGGVAVDVFLVDVGLSTDRDARETLDQAEIVARAGTSRLEPRARLDVPVEISYRGTSSESDLQVVVRGIDALGNAVEIRGGMPVR